MNNYFSIIIILLIFIIFILVYIIKNFKQDKISNQNIEYTVSNILKETNIENKMWEISNYAKEIRTIHTSIESMLRAPKERAAFGEMSLEVILSDQLPKDLFGIRKQILENKIPDAYIKSNIGIICIDSKFPLDNYRSMISTKDEKQIDAYKKDFLKNVDMHLDKIKNDYICPSKGTATFAFAYIPSESVYYFLQVEAFDLLLDYSRKGVQTISPLTLSQKVELIKADICSAKLSEDVEKVKSELINLKRRFLEIDEGWKIFYEKHLKNTIAKGEEIDRSYKKLKEEFDNISKIQ